MLTKYIFDLFQMSSMARIGIFGNLNYHDDYMSLSPTWYSNFMLRNLLPPVYFTISLNEDFHEKDTSQKICGVHFHDTGSLVEGLSVPRMLENSSNDSELEDVQSTLHFQAGRDIMVEMPQLIAGYYETENSWTLLIEDTRPGFAFLQIFENTDNPKSEPKYLENSNSETFCTDLLNTLYSGDLLFSEKHGPAISYNEGGQGDFPVRIEGGSVDPGPIDKDILGAIRCPEWPEVAENWIHRYRKSGWPSQSVVTIISNYGCHLVSKVHPKTKRENKLLAQLE